MSDRRRGDRSTSTARRGRVGGPTGHLCLRGEDELVRPVGRLSPAGPAGRLFPRAEDGCAGRVRLPGEHGSASVLVALWAVVLTVLGAGAGVLGSALAAREAVSAAADLAALAGASATLDEPDRACSRASAIARENGATLTECRVGATEVWVEARAPAPRPVQWLVPGRAGHLRARAHARLEAEDP